MKNNLKKFTQSVLLAILGLTILNISYVVYNEYQKVKLSNEHKNVEIICQVLGYDQEKNLVAGNCMMRDKK